MVARGDRGLTMPGMNAAPVLFTVGYEGRSLEDFVALLQAEGVRRVVDVRELPLSRREGFSKTPLRDVLAARSIEYVHVRAAGNPYRGMKGRIDDCLRLFADHLLRSPEVVRELEGHVLGSRAALLCVEASFRACHRSVLADRLRLLHPSLAVRHL